MGGWGVVVTESTAERDRIDYTCGGMLWPQRSVSDVGIYFQKMVSQLA